MKNLVYIAIFLGLTACEADVLLPCDAQGPTGKACREYRYLEDAAQGFVEFEYEADSTVISKIFNQQSNLVKTIVERFENEQTIIIAEQFPSNETRVQSWHYNTNDSLFQINYGSSDSLLEISYENGKRVREDYYHFGELDRWVDYRYYQDDGKLYRKSFYTSTDSLTDYQNYQYFSTGQYRIARYTPTHQLITNTVYVFSQLGLITSIETTNAEGEVTRDEKYIYDVAGKLIEQNALRFGQSSKSVYLYY